MKSSDGFTLVELLVCVAIIGLLASIVMPNFQIMQEKVRQSEAKAVLSSMYMAQTSFFAEFSTYSSEFDQVAFDITGPIQYNYGFDDYWPCSSPNCPNARSWAQPWTQCFYTNCQSTGSAIPGWAGQSLGTPCTVFMTPSWTCSAPYGVAPFS